MGAAVIENAIKAKTLTAITALVTKLGHDVNVLRHSSAELADEYTKAYGVEGNITEELTPVATVPILFVGDDLTVYDDFSIGRLEEGYILDPSDTIKIGDTIQMVRGDSRNRSFRVKEPEALGSTTDVYKRFKIVPVAKK